MIETQPFGSTGHNSTRTIFGAAALGQVSVEDSERTLEVLLRYGVNHIDTAASYGEAELRVGPWMKNHRKDFFLATKTEKRTKSQAREQIRRSLELLQVDQVDLLQLHSLSDPDEWETAMGPNGALEAAIEAREEGLVRFIGVTGHGTTIAAMHRRALERFAFDSVLLPYNYSMMKNPEYARDFEALIAVCRERGVAVQTIKSIARSLWGDTPSTRSTWYQPLEEQSDIAAAVHWVLSRSDVFLNTVGDINLLPNVLDAASKFQSATPDEARMNALETTPMFT